MFTGLVEEKGRIEAVQHGDASATLTIAAPLTHQDMKIGDSLAVNGCCLTVVAKSAELLTFEAVPETLQRTNLGLLKSGDFVNLERPLAVGARMGGHFVQGHIDGVGTIVAITEVDNGVVVEIEVPSILRRYIIEKGSVAVDGISLTVASITATTFTIWMIPHTRAVTTLGNSTIGQKVNLECDLLGKYIEQLLQSRERSDV